MGLFDKLKAATNAITGGAASVTLEIDPGASLSGGMTVRVHALAKANVRITSVYLDVHGTENAKVANIRQHSHLNSMGNKGEVTGSIVTAQQRYQISGAQDLVEGETYTWEHRAPLPHGMASFQGQTIGYGWTAQAAIDTPGADPDSGWTSFIVVP